MQYEYEIPALDYLDAVLSHPATMKFGVIFLIFILFRVFSHQKGFWGMEEKEFIRFSAFLLFFGSFIYMIAAERNRGHEYHVYGELYISIVVTGLFSVLHLDVIIPLLISLIESITRMILARKGGTVTKEVEAVTTTQAKVKTTETPSKNEVP